MRGGIGYDRDKIREAATLIVAASDSLHPERADYVCDSVADNVEIQAALDALPATGGRVVLLDGTFNTIVNITVPATATLEGQGFSTIVIPAGAAITNGIILNGNDIRLANFKIDLADGCGTGGARPNVVSATGRNHLLIENMYIVGDETVADDGSDVRQNGIMFDNVDESKIRNVWSEDNDRQGIILYNGSDLNEVIGCSCNDNTQTGFRLHTSSNNTVTGNTCNSNARYGIYLEESSNNNTISGNTCQGNTWNGILLEESSNNTVTGNTCQDNTRNGIFLYNSSNNNTISGNTCNSNTLYGILVETSNNNTVTGNTCQGNTQHGIFLASTSNNTVTGNTCQDNTRNGISLFSTSNNNTVTGNTCVDNDSGDTNTYDGIQVTSDSDYNLIQANKCYVTTPGARQRYGIRINSADCMGNLVIDNDLLQGGRTGNFSDAGTGTIYYDTDVDPFIDILAASATHVINAVDISAYIGGETPAIGAQPDYARNVTVTPFDNAGADLTLVVIVTGIDAKGNSVSETFTFAAPVAAQTGNIAFATITQVEVDTISNAAAGDTLSVGIGSKLGLSGVLYVAGDVYKVTKNSGDYASANYTPNVTYDTVDVSTGAAIIGSDTFIISFKSSRNRIS